MENEEISKYLTEKMGLCWHEYSSSSCCDKCHKWADARRKEWNYDNNLFSPDGFFILWNWVINQDWWKDFWYNKNRSITINKPDIINYKTFPIKIYNYLKESSDEK